MLVLGRLVGPGSTAVDDMFVTVSRTVVGDDPQWMLLFNRTWVLVTLFLVAIAIALWRREWRLAAIVAGCPVVSLIGSRILKQLFSRQWEGGTYAYPSGHTTVVITVTSMLVLVIGIRYWTALAAFFTSVFGSLGMACNHLHYFTDIVGGALWATSMVCLAVLAIGPAALARAPLARSAPT